MLYQHGGMRNSEVRATLGLFYTKKRAHHMKEIGMISSSQNLFFCSSFSKVDTDEPPLKNLELSAFLSKANNSRRQWKLISFRIHNNFRIFIEHFKAISCDVSMLVCFHMLSSTNPEDNEGTHTSPEVYLAYSTFWRSYNKLAPWIKPLPVYAQLAKKFSAFYGNRRFIIVFKGPAKFPYSDPD
jgi:hypothetical protein